MRKALVDPTGPKKSPSQGGFFPLTITKHGWVKAYASSGQWSKQGVVGTHHSLLQTYMKRMGRFLSTVTVLQVMLPGRERVEQEQVHQTAPAQLCSAQKQNCKAQLWSTTRSCSGVTWDPPSTFVQQRNILAVRLVHCHSRMILTISWMKGWHLQDWSQSAEQYWFGTQERQFPASVN